MVLWDLRLPQAPPVLSPDRAIEIALSESPGLVGLPAEAEYGSRPGFLFMGTNRDVWKVVVDVSNLGWRMAFEGGLERRFHPPNMGAKIVFVADKTGQIVASTSRAVPGPIIWRTPGDTDREPQDLRDMMCPAGEDSGELSRTEFEAVRDRIMAERSPYTVLQQEAMIRRLVPERVGLHVLRVRQPTSDPRLMVEITCSASSSLSRPLPAVLDYVMTYAPFERRVHTVDASPTRIRLDFIGWWRRPATPCATGRIIVEASSPTQP